MEPGLKVLSINRQCKLLGISRGSYYYTPLTKQDEADFKLLKKIKEVQIKHPEKGCRRIFRDLKAAGENVTEKQVRRVMKRFGVIAVFPGLNLSKACKNHKKYPYLLKGKVIRYPNQVWSTDITYIKLPTGNVYLMAITDWFSRKVLKWRLFNTMDVGQYARQRPRFGNIRIERLWRSLKYEDIYLKRYETMTELKASVNALDNKEAA